MKNKIFSILATAFAACILSLSASAQSYSVGSNVLNIGAGFGYRVNYGIGSSSTPVIAVGFEHGLKELGPGILGLGATFSYQGSNWKYNDGYGTIIDYHWNTSFFAARASWHPNVLIGDKYDVYGALQLGFYNYKYSYKVTGPNAGNYNYTNPLSNGVGLGFIVGGRYYFTENIGAFAEIGYDIAYSKLGVSVKF